MKKLTALILIALLCVATYAALEYHNELKRQDRERAEQSLRDCWQNARDNSAHIKLCESLAKTLEDK